MTLVGSLGLFIVWVSAVAWPLIVPVVPKMHSLGHMVMASEVIVEPNSLSGWKHVLCRPAVCPVMQGERQQNVVIGGTGQKSFYMDGSTYKLLKRQFFPKTKNEYLCDLKQNKDKNFELFEHEK